MEGEALYREVELVAIYRMEGEALYREVGLVVIYRIEGEAFYQEGGWEGGNLPTRGKGFLPRRGWQVAIYRMERGFLPREGWEEFFAIPHTNNDYDNRKIF